MAKPLPKVQPALQYGRTAIPPGLYRCWTCWPEETPVGKLLLMGRGLIQRHLEMVHKLSAPRAIRLLKAGEGRQSVSQKPLLRQAWRAGNADGKPGWKLLIVPEPGTVAAIKKIPAEYREYDPTSTEWWVACEREEQLAAIFPSFGAYLAQLVLPGLE